MLRLALHWQILIAMAVGAVAGLLLNFTASDAEYASAPEAKRPWTIHDTTDQTTIRITSDGATTTYIVDGEYTPGSIPGDVKQDADGAETHYMVTLDQLQERYPEAGQLFREHGRSWARWLGDGGKALGTLFLRMLQMVAVPLIMASLITGVTGLGHAGRLGPMFGRTIAYYMTTSLLAIVTGLVMVNLIEPGNRGGKLEAPAAADEFALHESTGLGGVLWDQLLNLIPPNPFEAIATGNFLSIIAFSLAFAVFSLAVGGKTLETVQTLSEAAFEVIMRMTVAIIHLAPIGVFGMMLSVTATQGGAVFGSLGWYMMTVALALGFHAFVTLPLVLKFVARRSPWEFAKAMSPALLTAFSSASSNGTLPLTLTCAEQRGGVSNRVSSFVLPLGATVNMDGTALYEAVAVLFIAQWTAGIDLSLTQQIVVAFTALLASVGAAGIPHAGLVMMIIILKAVGLPTEQQALIIAVDRILDMCRTSVNVWSDSCGCAVIDRLEAGGLLGRRPAPPDESLEDQP